ncbi:hypothetical protein BMETH_1839_0 [methanotrophic bacterial endosymbiont of Bathymodiolus sp.]|nr:hypothetical protein BMETH_1839_0 [methanotrophic bacterial endosymbiont of Bathymodiolus sp.]
MIELSLYFVLVIGFARNGWRFISPALFLWVFVLLQIEQFVEV